MACTFIVSSPLNSEATVRCHTYNHGGDDTLGIQELKADAPIDSPAPRPHKQWDKFLALKGDTTLADVVNRGMCQTHACLSNSTLPSPAPT